MFVHKSWRLFALWLLLCVAVAGLLWRLVDLNILDRSFLLRQSKARILRVVNIPAYRGMITDRLGSPLAISTPVDSVWINPQLFHATADPLQALSWVLHLSSSFIIKRANSEKNNDRQFVYLKRGNPPYVGERVKSLKIPGVFLEKPEGAFYTIVKLPVEDTEKFCQWLLTDFSYQKATIML